ncbi:MULTISPECIES: glycosyltransferase family 4 protein [Streptomyces]|uniref:glycosyltransferase family 4 protein n=1 Tax=Streptomyces TaxID=1883 RepID=UPI00163CAE65|nr:MULTISPECIES: glycosyltransferase family 4 protein [Streptomyces]MBC2879325.1 glycosyltransferase family 4 protein [Streptomyces sp. TYQ1024]UBI40077.1 glycosyltransferase family 4 protein [Streptomyces mobaraensis]UKW32656.1 glycosyltransferase family 4 protein [Streptomyces sp. TYQ1024]
MNIAFVLLTHNPDEPAGIERSIASLAEGLREAGHHPLIIAAGPATPADHAGLLRLSTLTLPRPAREEDLLALLADPAPVVREVRHLLTAHRAELVCWADAVWGLGYLSPAPPGVATALMVHVPRADEAMHQSLAHGPRAVLTTGDFMIREMAGADLDTSSWHAVPNALLHLAAPPHPSEREKLRRGGAVRIVARAEPHKGIAELLAALPTEFGRRVQIVLAEAGFEYWPGMQNETIARCRKLAAGLPEVELRRALPWQQVQPFLAGAAATLIGSTSPETFGNVAAEALSVGTPVVGYGLGHLPALVGTAGRMVALDDGPEQIWQTLADLLDDREEYHASAQQGPAQVADLAPHAVAAAFLAAAAPRETS